MKSSIWAGSVKLWAIGANALSPVPRFPGSLGHCGAHRRPSEAREHDGGEQGEKSHAGMAGEVALCCWMCVCRAAQSSRARGRPTCASLEVLAAPARSVWTPGLRDVETSVGDVLCDLEPVL